VIILQHKNRQGALRGSLDWRNAADRTIDLDADVEGIRTLKTIERRDGDEEQEVRFRFQNVPVLTGCGMPRLELERVGGNLPGQTKTHYCADRLGVISREVVDAADGWPANSGMEPVVIVGVQEPCEGSCTLGF